MDKYQKFRRHIRFCFSASIGGIFYVIKYCADPACWNVYELDLSGLKKIGRSAVMMCFVPASLWLHSVNIHCMLCRTNILQKTGRAIPRSPFLLYEGDKK